MAKKPQNEFETAGYKRVNPEQRFYAFDGADALQGYIVDRKMVTNKQGKERANYHVFCLAECKNGKRYDKEKKLISEPAFYPGEIVIVSETAALTELSHYVGQHSCVAIMPKEKITLNNGQTFWKVEIYVRSLSKDEKAMIGHYLIPDKPIDKPISDEGTPFD